MNDSIENSELLYRRINPDQVKLDGGISSSAFQNDHFPPISSGAFNDPELSVDRAKLREPRETISNFKDRGVASIVAGFARELDQQVLADPLPDNKAHALVKGKKTKSIARKLAQSAKWVIRISE